METVKGPQNDFEQVLQNSGYKLRETVDIAGRAIQVYEKPQNPKYAVKTETRSDRFSYEDNITEVLKILEQRLVLVDGFKDHTERSNWETNLEREENSEAKISYKKLWKESRLRINRVQSLYPLLELLEDQIKEQEVKEKFVEMFKKIQAFVKSKNYQQLSSSEKVLYMEEIDKKVMEIVDILRQNEQGESSLKA